MRTAAALLTFLLAAVTVGGAEPEPAFAGWPKGWVDAYRRFEKVIAAQKENVPASDLEISPEGSISSSLPDEIDRETHTTVVFYRDGADILEMGLVSQLFSQGRERFFPPGTYATCPRTTGKLVGYQYVHPLQWFQVVHAEDTGRMIIRTIEQPQPEMDYWPNDRLLRFCDFQVLPKINPLRFFRENNKVSPSVILAVTNAGVVQREKLDDVSEKLLHWRIYLNGRVVEKGPATGDLQHGVTQGMGTYVAFAGVEGPDGFMPVSNFLQFPLFPERNGSMAVIPSATNKDGLPDCILDAIAPDQLNQLHGLARQFQDPGAHDRAMSYGLSSMGPAIDPKKQALISLWSTWSWSVDLARTNPASDIGRIHMAPVAK